MKEDIIFLCCILRVEENMGIMKQLQYQMKQNKESKFSIRDALFIYFYFCLGLQCEACIKYLDLYMKKLNSPLECV